MPAGQTVGGRGGVAVDSSGALCGRVVESARATAATATAFAPSWPLQALAWSRARRFDWWRLGNRGYLGERPLAAPTHPRTVVVHPSRLHRRSSPTPIARTTRPCGIGSVASRLDATTGPTSTAMTAFAFSEGDASRDRSQPLTLRSTIELTETERRIFDLLLQVNRYHRLNTVLRVAGGWVRDKLLGLAVQRADLDIAIDDMPGQAYALKVNEMLRATGHEQHAVHVIQANPEQSKHLETARMKLCGEWIDLAHLRKETYTEHSRIPQVTIGTPHEDAHRRDLTINALFYNIHSGDVEDFTGRGVEDLRHGRIRTPLAPRVTLLDDPLRILRAVRFGSRFDFDMVPELLQGGRDPEVHAALAAKVSRERVGAEVEGMFRGPRPERAVRWMSDMGLFPVVFSLPPDCARDYAADMSRQAAARLECLRAAACGVRALPITAAAVAVSQRQEATTARGGIRPERGTESEPSRRRGHPLSVAGRRTAGRVGASGGAVGSARASGAAGAAAAVAGCAVACGVSGAAHHRAVRDAGRYCRRTSESAAGTARGAAPAHPLRSIYPSGGTTSTGRRQSAATAGRRQSTQSAAAAAATRTPVWRGDRGADRRAVGAPAHDPTRVRRMAARHLRRVPLRDRHTAELYDC
eukprot:ctg_769.g384